MDNQDTVVVSRHDANDSTVSNANRPKKKLRIKKPILIVAAALVLIVGSALGYLIAVSPSAIRYPAADHYHFRLQVVVNGNVEDFSQSKYQQVYDKGVCSAELPAQPIHFHDNKDQFVHIHWKGVTGGMVMKYYGWNFVGGLDESLGYRLDEVQNIRKVPIQGKLLPTVNKDIKYYVYTGDSGEYRERNFEDWTRQDLEKFFGRKSTFPAAVSGASILDWIFPRALAHGGIEDGADGEPGEDLTQEQLEKLNNLMDNVVIFAQKDKPNDQQIKDRFNALEPLSSSTCGG